MLKTEYNRNEVKRINKNFHNRNIIAFIIILYSLYFAGLKMLVQIKFECPKTDN